MTTKTAVRPVLAGTITTVSATPVNRESILLRAADMVKGRTSKAPLALFHNIEFDDRKTFRGKLIAGTVLEVIAQAAADLGKPVTDDASKATIGDIMDAGLLKREQIHTVSCDCGGAISDDEAAGRIEGFALAT